MNQSKFDEILKWIDLIAKSLVIITAALYLTGRTYTESYYGRMGLPTSNLPLSFQEYLFHVTKSFNILKSFLGAVAPAALFFVVMRLWELFQSYRSSSKSDKFQWVTRIWNSFKANAFYIVLPAILPSFILLLIIAQESGKADAEQSIRSAPIGRVLLNHPAIPELQAEIHQVKQDEYLYEYGNLPIVGTLGEDYLFVFHRGDSKATILTVPASQIVSIHYISSTLSLTTTEMVTSTVSNSTVSPTTTVTSPGAPVSFPVPYVTTTPTPVKIQ